MEHESRKKLSLKALKLESNLKQYINKRTDISIIENSYSESLNRSEINIHDGVLKRDASAKNIGSAFDKPLSKDENGTLKDEKREKKVSIANNSGLASSEKSKTSVDKTNYHSKEPAVKKVQRKIKLRDFENLELISQNEFDSIGLAYLQKLYLIQPTVKTFFLDFISIDKLTLSLLYETHQRFFLAHFYTEVPRIAKKWSLLVKFYEIFFF